MREYTYDWNPEEYNNEDGKVLKITKSSYNLFCWCPLKYKFNYIDGLKQDTSPAMLKGSEVHNAREGFFDDFDIVKAENMSHSELLEYCIGLHPVDDNTEIYRTMSTFEADRFTNARMDNKINDFLPVINEVLLDAELEIDRFQNSKFPLRRNYTVHLQGIVDRMYHDGGKYVPIELKTGLWKEWKKTSIRREMSFYKMLFDLADDEQIESLGLDPNIEITHWGWYYPESNYLHIEKIKTASINATKKGLARLIHSYEFNDWEAKYFWKTCPDCSYYNLCDKAQAESFF